MIEVNIYTTLHYIDTFIVWSYGSDWLCITLNLYDILLSLHALFSTFDKTHKKQQQKVLKK